VNATTESKIGASTTSGPNSFNFDRAVKNGEHTVFEFSKFTFSGYSFDASIIVGDNKVALRLDPKDAEVRSMLRDCHCMVVASLNGQPHEKQPAKMLERALIPLVRDANKIHLQIMMGLMNAESIGPEGRGQRQLIDIADLSPNCKVQLLFSEIRAKTAGAIKKALDEGQFYPEWSRSACPISKR
jgi:hypothetical protein